MSLVTCKEFNNLSHDEQTWYIWNGAIHLHVREVYGYRVNLFYCNEFYSERWYSINENSIKKIKSFDNSALLAPYLETIKIDSLLNIDSGFE